MENQDIVYIGKQSTDKSPWIGYVFCTEARAKTLQPVFTDTRQIIHTDDFPSAYTQLLRILNDKYHRVWIVASARDPLLKILYLESKKRGADIRYKNRAGFTISESAFRRACGIKATPATSVDVNMEEPVSSESST